MTKYQRIFLVFTLPILLIFISCGGGQPEEVAEEQAQTEGDQESENMLAITFPSLDGITISANYHDSGNSMVPACLLVHMLGGSKSDYASLQEKLGAVGIASLAIDLRGHGGSTESGTQDYTTFTDVQWQDCENDVLAGYKYLAEKGHTAIAVVGASIGANLSVVAGADIFMADENAPLKAMVLMSPGVNYRGVVPAPRARELGNIPVLIAASEEDRQSYPGSQSLSQAARNAELTSFSGSSHGTRLFASEAGFEDDVVEWLKENLNEQ